MNKRFKILLINPPWYRLFGQTFYYYPLGLCYLAGVLEKHGFDVSVYNSDYNYKELTGDLFLNVSKVTKEYPRYLDILKDIDNPLWQEIELVISQQSPNIVGISILTGKYGSALNIARLVKRFDSNIPVVVGGIHPTILPEEMLNNKEIDIVVRGEGEYTFLDLVRTIETGGSLDNVLGISYKQQNKIIQNPNRSLIKNLDDLPFPARHLLLEKETYPSSAYGDIFATRGCPYHCIFCASHQIWTRKVRFRSPENVVNEIKYVKRTFGTRRFSFQDDSFAINKQYAMKICDLLIKEKVKIPWGCETRADMITSDLVTKMKAAGCERINIGVESGDEEILKKIKKGVTVEQIKKAQRIIKQNGITLIGFFMMGFPWETKKEIGKTVSVMKELDPDFAIFSIVTPYPGTELYDICISDGMISRDLDWSSFFHQSPQMGLNKNLTTEEFSELIKYEQEVFDKHNRRKRIEKILTHPLSALQLVYRTQYYKPRFFRSLFRSLRR